VNFSAVGLVQQKEAQAPVSRISPKAAIAKSDLFIFLLSQFQKYWHFLLILHLIVP
jgi:hypothetical protein